MSVARTHSYAASSSSGDQPGSARSRCFITSTFDQPRDSACPPLGGSAVPCGGGSASGDSAGGDAADSAELAGSSTDPFAGAGACAPACAVLFDAAAASLSCSTAEPPAGCIIAFCAFMPVHLRTLLAPGFCRHSNSTSATTASTRSTLVSSTALKRAVAHKSEPRACGGEAKPGHARGGLNRSFERAARGEAV